MNIQNIYELMERFENSSITELELEMEGTCLRLNKATCEAVPVVETVRKPVVTTAAPAAEPVVAESTAANAVKSPLVGTFYRAASPDDQPYVLLGQQVKKGDVVGIVEAMKMMNEITAPCDGTIKAIKVENGEMVQYDQILIEME